MTAINKRWFVDRMRQVGLTQIQLGERIGRERTAISNLLSGGRSLKIDELEPLADALKVTQLQVLANAGVPDAAEAEAALIEQRRQRPVDAALLSDVISATMEWLAEQQYELAPSELGELTSVIYDLVARERAANPEATVDVGRYSSVADLVIRKSAQ